MVKGGDKVEFQNVCELIFKDVKQVKKGDKEYTFITLVAPETYDKVTLFAKKGFTTEAMTGDRVKCSLMMSEVNGKAIITLESLEVA
jgi:hypothetical protein